MEVVQPQVAPTVIGRTWSFEQYQQLEKEKAKIEREILQNELDHEKMRVEVALDRERVKVEQLKLELIKDGKAQESLLNIGRRSESGGVHAGFELLNVCILP